jgi:hypothetical protein
MTMSDLSAGAWWAWPLALALYLAFRFWYDKPRGPLSKTEIDALLDESNRSPVGEHTDRAVLRAFLEADDGREFVMSNLVRVHPGEVPHPVTGVPTPGLQLLQEYGTRFVKVLLLHGGHPMLVMRKVGGYVDSWNTPPDPGWHIVGAMRYRSRRDMMELARNPTLRDVHPFKTAGTAMTFSFPTQVMMGFAMRPRVWVGLVLALAAALVHLASLMVLLSRHAP